MNRSDCVLCGEPDTELFATVEGKRYRRCDACKVTFMDAADRLGRAEEHAHYRLHNNDPADLDYRAFLARLTDQLIPHLGPGARGLDYGCGSGPTVYVLMRERGFEVVNYDPLFVPDAAALRDRYDFITCTEVAEHFYDPRGEFARLDALLRPGGWLGVMTRLLARDQDFAGWHYRRDPTHVVFYKSSTFEFLARRFGWRMRHPAPDIVLLQKLGERAPAYGVPGAARAT